MNAPRTNGRICAEAVPFAAIRADTPIGHHSENLRRMFNSLAEAKAAGDEAKQAKLELSIRRQWADLVGLTGGVQ